MLLSVIIPCRNEERLIEKCIFSIQHFEVPDGLQIEILIIDGLSDDNTRKILGNIIKVDSRIRLVDNPRKFSVYALNLGIAEAKGELIMRLDAHSIYPPNYLKDLYTTWCDIKADCVGGVIETLPGDESFSAKLVQGITTHQFGVGNSSFRTTGEHGYKDTVPFGFFHREVFRKFGKYNELLIRGEDYEFSSRIRNGGGKIWQNGNVIIKYFNQPSLFTFYKKQFTQEAPYNVYMWYLAPYTFAFRHSFPGLFAAGVLGGIIVSFFFKILFLIFISVMALYGLMALFSAVQQALRYRTVLFIPILPFCFLGFHLAYGFGIITGLIKILLHISPVQKKQ